MHKDREVHAGPQERENLAGRLLVASPQLVDPNFSRAVVLVLEHGGPGAVGVVLNRPMHVGVGEILLPWEELSGAAPPGVIFSGGPVSPDAVIGLAASGVDAVPPTPGAEPQSPPTSDEAGEESKSDWHTVVAGVAVVDLSVPPDEQPVALRSVRLFSGYSGWDAEQLEGEIDEGAWFVLDALPGDILGAAPEVLWHDVLQRQGGKLAMLATYPPTPTVN